MTTTRNRTEPKRTTGLLLTVAAVTLATTLVAKGDWTRTIRYESKPNKKSVLQSFKSPKDIGDHYSACIRGFVYPSKSGEYRFAVTGDDMTKLYLSTGTSPKNKKLLAYTDEWSPSGTFNRHPTQKSNPVRLQAGKRYYIEAIHCEKTGGDHLSVGWITPGSSTFVIIPGSRLSPFPTGNKGKIYHELWRVPEAPPIKGTPNITVTSRNDPTKPVPGGVRWFWNNHQSNLQKTKADNFDLCFLGDSVTSGWPGNLLNKYFGKYRPSNFGIGGDRTENVLFRLNNGELAFTSPKVVVLLIGVNNLAMGNNPGEVALGTALVIRKLRGVVPNTKILLLGIFPTKNLAKNKKVIEVNRFLAKMDDGKMVRYLNINAKFFDKDGKVRNELMRDEVHITGAGYVLWAEGIAPALAKMMKEEGPGKR